MMDKMSESKCTRMWVPEKEQAPEGGLAGMAQPVFWLCWLLVPPFWPEPGRKVTGRQRQGPCPALRRPRQFQST